MPLSCSRPVQASDGPPPAPPPSPPPVHLPTSGRIRTPPTEGLPTAQREGFTCTSSAFDDADGGLDCGALTGRGRIGCRKLSPRAVCAPPAVRRRLLRQCGSVLHMSICHVSLVLSCAGQAWPASRLLVDTTLNDPRTGLVCFPRYPRRATHAFGESEFGRWLGTRERSAGPLKESTVSKVLQASQLMRAKNFAVHLLEKQLMLCRSLQAVGRACHTRQSCWSWGMLHGHA